MKKYLAFALIFILFFIPALTKEKRAAFDAQAAWGYIKDLASDSMMGRLSGQPSGVWTEEYVAAKFKEWGLDPAGDRGEYFQNFTIEHRHVEEGVVFELKADKEQRSFFYGEDWRVQSYSGSGHFTAELIFVGYGIHAPQKEYDDYQNVDVKGKLVFFSSGSPSRLRDKLEEEIKIQNRIKAAQDLGAAGVLVSRELSSQEGRFRMRLEKDIYRPDFVILTVQDDRVPRFLFKDLDTEQRTLYQEIDRTSKPKSFPTGVKAFVSVNASFDAHRATRNVLAKIEGTEEVLKDECVIIGAHMDHLGITPSGEVMNGANDNASGTAVVMELARVMKMNEFKPKRTVIFALWAAEEQGLLGSNYFVDDPVIPLHKTVANLNLDMVGQGYGKLFFRGVNYGARIWNLLKERLPQDILKTVQPGPGSPRSSDHAPFMRKGIPAYFIQTRPYVKLHQSRDDSDLISPGMLKKTGEFVQAAIKVLASEPGDIIEPLREETFNLKYQTLIDFKVSPLDSIIQNHQTVEDSHVDLQLFIIQENEGLEGDNLRMDILNRILAAPEKIRKAKGLRLHSSGRFRGNVPGRTTLMAGLKGIRSLADNPKWARVLASQGIFFILIEAPSVFFSEEDLSEEGKAMIEALNQNGILMCVHGLDTARAKVLLRAAKKPLILFSEDVPETEVLELIKKSGSGLGLVLSRDLIPSAYVQKLDQIKALIGTENLCLVNESSLSDEVGKTQTLLLISEMLKAEYERTDLSNLFSRTFLRVLREVREEENTNPYAYLYR